MYLILYSLNKKNILSLLNLSSLLKNRNHSMELKTNYKLLC